MDYRQILFNVLIIIGIITLFVGILSILVAIYLAFKRKAGTGEVKENESKDYKLDKLNK